MTLMIEPWADVDSRTGEIEPRFTGMIVNARRDSSVPSVSFCETQTQFIKSKLTSIRVHLRFESPHLNPFLRFLAPFCGKNPIATPRFAHLASRR